MVNCELCGERPAAYKIRVETAIMQACEACSSYGNMIAKIEAPQKLGVKQGSYEEPEELLIENYGVKIKSARETLKLAQEEFAARLNINLAVLKAAEGGKRLDLNVAKKIEKMLKIKLIES